MLNLLDYFRTAQPGLDLKPGTVARDLFIEGHSLQTARIYDELNSATSVQSIKSATGTNLDRFGDNYNVPRKPGSKSSGTALLSFSTLDIDVTIRSGDIINGKNGSTFTVLSNTVVSSVYASQYKAVASKFRSDLDFVGISDPYAVEVTLEAASPGVLGNLSKYSLSTTNIAGVSNVTNVSPFGGGSGSEDDNSYRNRILAIFSGANTGTALGYKNAVMSDPAVIDSLIIGPGDTLMTRDGTDVSVAPDGTRTVISEGPGGKVDVIVFGIRLQENTDSYIYRDLSNTGDPTNIKNDFVLGQITGDENKTVTKKRLDNLASKVLPCQPINNIIEVTSQRSGANFAQKTVDSLGRVSGNYELIRDGGAYGGSPWGFDRLRWINDRIVGFGEEKTKLTYNGQEGLGYTDVLNIQYIKQNIQIINENSQVLASNRTSVQLAHSLITNVTRVFNVTTGERYVIADQNPGGTGSVNTTGKITISGKSLPSISDILQVDYTWVLSYDRYIDFDNKTTKLNPRPVLDSVDWGFSNAVRREKSMLISSGAYLTVTTTHPISSVINVNLYSSESKVVILQSSKLSVNLTDTVINVVSVVRDSDNAELWNTNKSDGVFSGKTLYFPTDSTVNISDLVVVTYNTEDVYNTTTQGSFSDNKVTIVPSVTAVAGKLVECSYIADISTLLPTTLLSSLPVIRSGNFFNVGGLSVGCQPTTHIFAVGTTPASNLRKAPTNLALTISGSVSPGIITISGTTITGVLDIVYTASYNGLKQDISAALKSFLSLSSKSTIPSGIVISKINKVEKVTTTSALEVLSVDYEYDLLGCKLYDNTFARDEYVQDLSLKVTEFVLPETSGNNLHIPVVGDRIRVSFHYTTGSSQPYDTENVAFSKSGTLYTNKKFATIQSIAISSGFTSKQSASASLSIVALNQPSTRSRYKTTYDYLAPKTNERITIRTNYDRLVTDATLSIENTRPINADVLAKSASPVLIDVTMKIIVTSSYVNSPNTVIQNVRDAVTSVLNANSLNTIVDSSDLVNAAYTVSGVDSARVIYFNKTGTAGSVLSISAQKNEHLVSNTVTIEQESR